jgi:hypothetical protein
LGSSASSSITTLTVPACPDWLHCSTNGEKSPVWQEPQVEDSTQAAGSVGTLTLASGRFAIVGLEAWSKPDPWQLSHCTSWYAVSATALYPAGATVAFPRSLTEWQLLHSAV